MSVLASDEQRLRGSEWEIPPPLRSDASKPEGPRKRAFRLAPVQMVPEVATMRERCRMFCLMIRSRQPEPSPWRR